VCPRERRESSPLQAATAHRSQHVLWLQSLSKGCPAVSCSSECPCDSGTSQPCAPRPLATSSWAAAGAGIFAGQLKERALWTAQARGGQSCEQSAYSRIPPGT